MPWQLLLLQLSIGFTEMFVLQVELFVYVTLCFAAEPWALQHYEETGDSTLGKSFHH